MARLKKWNEELPSKLDTLAKEARPTGSAIVSLSRIEDATFWRARKSVTVPGYGKVDVFQAPHATDVKWATFGASAQERWDGGVKSGIWSILLLLPCLCVSIGGVFLQFHINEGACSAEAIAERLANGTGTGGWRCFILNQGFGIIIGSVYGLMFGLLPNWTEHVEKDGARDDGGGLDRLHRHGGGGEQPGGGVGVGDDGPQARLDLLGVGSLDRHGDLHRRDREASSLREGGEKGLGA